MAKVEIFTTPFCPYCYRAKKLLDSKGVAYEEINLWTNPKRRQEMLERAEGRHTVPQVFIDGRGLGGSDDLAALDQEGELDAILAAGRPAP